MGPFAEDLIVGVPLRAAPTVTIDEGIAAQYLAISGDPLPLALSAPLSRRITGRPNRLVNPNLAISVSIGQSTVATRQVIANLAYRNLHLTRQLFIGESLRTVVTPLGAELTRSGTDRAKVLLGMDLLTSEGELISRYQRLALLPIRSPERFTEVSASVGPLNDLSLKDFARYVPNWNASAAQASLPSVGQWIEDPLGDTTSSARELVRLTQNLAAVHRDERATSLGRRLVYGGHTIALAQASMSRLLPDLLTVLAWRSCSHIAPVHEDQLLSFRLRVDGVTPVGAMMIADATVCAFSNAMNEPELVMEWRPVILLGREVNA